MEDAGAHVGFVVAASDGTARIRFLRGSACAHCGACLSAGESEMEITLPNTLGAKQGDRVAVDLSPKRMVQASLLAYAVPLLLLIAGVLVGSRYADWAGLALGISACGLGYLLLRIVEKRSAKVHRFEPKMTRIVEDCEQPD